MPAFNFTPVEDLTALDALEPIEIGPRQRYEQKVEDKLGLGGQFMNALGSPDLLSGVLTGPVNGVSKLTNALGDAFQNLLPGVTKPIDTSDAWTISDEQVSTYLRPAARFAGSVMGFSQNLELMRQGANVSKAIASGELPGRAAFSTDEITAADPYGIDLGEMIGAETAGGVALAGIKNIPRVQSLLARMRNTQQVKNLAVAASVPGRTRTAVKFAGNAADGLSTTVAATAFMDNSEGNLGNLPELWGGKPIGLGVQPGDDYLEATRKTALLEGLLLPLAVLGVAAPVRPLRNAVASGDLPGGLQALADAELAPYMAPLTKAQGQKYLPAMQTVRQNVIPPEYRAPSVQKEPRLTPKGGPIVPYDSAISRGLSENLQVQQVKQQRTRLENMGLLVQTDGLRQLDLGLNGVVDPGIRTEIKELQMQRGVAIREGAGEAVLANIDEQIDNLTMQGRSNRLDFVEAGPEAPPEKPDPRPELDTMLAQLDELSDSELVTLLENVNEPVRQAQRNTEMLRLNETVQNLQQEIINIRARVEDETLPKSKRLTKVGAARKITKIEASIAQAQQELGTLEASNAPKQPSLVGDQLEIVMQEGQQELDLAAGAPAPDVELPALRQFSWDEETGTWRKDLGGYPNTQAYREEISGWNRDLLRQMANPSNSPEVAALVKARTGRRVYQAKKGDIVDAFVEIAQRRNRYLDAEEFRQLGIDMGEYGVQGELLPLEVRSEARRERMKQQLLEAAVRNGEVQPPFSPLPERPLPELSQTYTVQQVIDDPAFARAYAEDAIPTYKAGNKGVDEMLEEMRLRFDYAELDAQAWRMQRNATMDAIGWDRLTWEQKKASGLLDLKIYSMGNGDIPFAKEDLGFRRPELQTGFTRTEGPVVSERPTRAAEPPRKPQRYSYTADGLIKEKVAVPKTPAPKAEPKAKAPTTEKVDVQFSSPEDPMVNQPKALSQRVEKETRKGLRISKQSLARVKQQIEELRAQQIGRAC